MHLSLITLALVAASAATIAQDSKPRPRSAPKVLLRYQFKKGDKGTYQRRVHSRNLSSSTGLPRHTISLNDYSWEVVRDGKAAVMEWSLDRIRGWSGAPGAFEDRWHDDSDRDPDQIDPSFDLGKKITFQVDSRGRIKILGIEDEARRDLKRCEIQSVIRELPELPIGIGEHWETEIRSPRGALLPARTTTSNRLMDHSKGRVRVEFESHVDQQAFKITRKRNRGFVELDLRRFIPDDMVHELRRDVVLGNSPFQTEHTLQVAPTGKLGPLGTPGGEPDNGKDGKKSEAKERSGHTDGRTSRPVRNTSNED